MFLLILIKCVIKDDNKFYPQLFLEKTLFVKQVWHPTRLWDWYMSGDEKKRIEPIFIVKSIIKVGRCGKNPFSTRRQYMI